MCLHNQFFKLTIVFLGFCLCFLSCTKDSENDYEMNNQNFVTIASSNNNFKILANEIAKTKGRAEIVTAYGNEMERAYSILQLDIKSLADSKGWYLPETTDLMLQHKRYLNALNDADPLDFDRKFAQIMVASHQELVAHFEIGARDDGVRDTNLRRLAATKLPLLKTYLQRAAELREALN